MQSGLLRDRLPFHLREREIIPDQQGRLRTIGKILYPPKKLTDGTDRTPFERWSAYSGRPSNWLHGKALTRNRLASIDRLFVPRWQGDVPAAPRATIGQWLSALVSLDSHIGVYSAIEEIEGSGWLRRRPLDRRS